MATETVLNFRGSAEFSAWFDRLAEFSRRPKATLIEHALLTFAEGMGFPEKPPPRA